MHGLIGQKRGDFFSDLPLRHAVWYPSQQCDESNGGALPGRFFEGRNHEQRKPLVERFRRENDVHPKLFVSWGWRKAPVTFLYAWAEAKSVAGEFPTVMPFSSMTCCIAFCR